MLDARMLVAVLVATMIAGCSEDPIPPSPTVESEPIAEVPAAPAADSVGVGGPVAGASGIPATITAERGGFIPEGIEYDTQNERFLVGSLAEGSIFTIGNDGSVTPFIEDSELVSSVGIEVDEERNRLLVANSDSAVFQQDGARGQAKLGIFNLLTGERIAMVDLTAAFDDVPENAAFFANDVAVGGDGTAYVTDTRMNVVYRVGEDHQASILYRFEGEEGPGLNGIVYRPSSGDLLVVGGGSLYKIPTADPGSMSEVMLAEPLAGADGMVFVEDDRLAVVSNSESAVQLLTSTDDWATAQAAGRASFEGQGTTAAVADGEVYVVKPHFNDQDPPSIERVTFQ